MAVASAGLEVCANASCRAGGGAVGGGAGPAAAALEGRLALCPRPHAMLAYAHHICGCSPRTSLACHSAKGQPALLQAARHAAGGVAARRARQAPAKGTGARKENRAGIGEAAGLACLHSGLLCCWASPKGCGARPASPLAPWGS